MDPIEFLRTHPPFDGLDEAGLALVASSLEIAFVPRGTRVLEHGGERSRHLYVVRKGAVRLERDGQAVQVVEEGELFGFPSLIAQAAPLWDVLAAEDTLLYEVPEATFRRLMERPEFAAFFLLDLSARLRKNARNDASGGADAWTPAAGALATRATALATRTPVWVEAAATVQDAARTMRDQCVSSVLVRGDEPAILTDRDLRSRLLAEGRGPDTPVRAIASAPLRCLSADDATLFEVLVFMLEHRIHHVPLLRDGQIVAVVTDSDVLRHQVHSPLRLLDSALGGPGPGNGSGFAREETEVVQGLVAGGLDAVQIGRVVSQLNDALVVQLLRGAEDEMGAPPCAYAWMVFGSEGRMEQALVTDQDNALVYEQDTPEARSYFGEFARKIVDGLIAASFPPCRGGFMATNWNRPLAEWHALFRTWMAAPEPRALMEAANFFDFRRVHGALDLGPLQGVLFEAPREQIFLAHMARLAIQFSPPIGMFRQIVEREGGVDLKRGGLIPIVSLGRLYALEARSPVRPTLARLDAAARVGALSREGASTLSEAFRFLLDLRLRCQLQAIRDGQQPDNRARLDHLSPLERRHLKETFLAIRELQEATALRYSVARLA